MKEFRFQRAKAVWAENRELEKNCELAFRTVLPGGRSFQIALAASSIYRIWINGSFFSAGPARAAHGFFRVDEYDLTERLARPENVVVIEAVGYNVNSYDTLNQPSFLTAEILEKGKAVMTAGRGIEAYDLRRRIQKVQRYSFQRAFIDAYDLPEDERDFYEKIGTELPKEKLVEVGEKHYLEREVRYPEFDTLSAEKFLEKGKAFWETGQTSLIGEEAYFQVGETLKGFPYEEVSVHVSEDAQRIRCIAEKERTDFDKTGKSALGNRKGGMFPLRLNGEYGLFCFPYNATGFFRVELIAAEESGIYLQFDELAEDHHLNFLRMYSCNCFYYHIRKGRHCLMSFAPYTMKYLKLIVLGDCTVDRVSLVEYKHPPVKRKLWFSGDKALEQIYQAALESFYANSLDVFMDCPSRERGGWLCDSYFTSQAEFVLTGENRLEHAFLENFLMNPGFLHLPEKMFPMCYPADHDNGNFIPNWGMWFVLELEGYWKRSKDNGLVGKAKEAVYRLIAYFEDFENEAGLLENLDGWVFLEWSRANDQDLTRGVNFPSNMLYDRMLLAAGELYGDGRLKRKAEALRKAIRERSFNGRFYTDHEHREGGGWVNPNVCTEVCQYYAFFTGVASVQEDEELWNILRFQFGPERKRNGSYGEIAFTNAFIGMYLRIELLYRNGLYEEAVENIKEYFLPMAEKTGTLWEHEKPTGSCNHGFASYVICWLEGIYGGRKRERLPVRFLPEKEATEIRT